MVKLVILGATGSIGTTCLNSLRTHSFPVKVVGVTADRKRKELEEISREFDCPSLLTEGDIAHSGLKSFIESTKCDIVLNAVAGFDGLYATKTVLELGLDIALANKESVVAGSCFIFALAAQSHARIIPVDSEHSAIYNLIKGHSASKLVITASGGPFVDRDDLSTVTKEEALNHPTWKMGEKITIDSATLANKGLEVIEASRLFGFSPENIEVVVHRQSVVHSLIRRADGAVYAQLSPPDMALAIMSAVSDGRFEAENVVRPLSFKDLNLTFEEPKRDKFPMLGYAYKALSIGDSGCIIYNASDEEAVRAFLSGSIRFDEIEKVVGHLLEDVSLTSKQPSGYDDVLALDRAVREKADVIIREKPWRG